MTGDPRDAFERDLAEDLGALADTPLPGRKTPDALSTAAAAADRAPWWRGPALVAAGIVAVVATGVALSFDPAQTAQQSSSPGPATASPGLTIGELRYSCHGDHPFHPSLLKELPVHLLTDPAGNVLGTFIATAGGGRLPATGWHEAGRDDWSASFVAAELGIPIAYAQLRRLADGWKVVNWGTGCRGALVVSGANPADWRLSPDQEITPQATSFYADVTERSCVGGQSSEGRIKSPIVDYGAEHVAIAFTVARPPADTLAFCIANPPSRVRVDLAEPLGERFLWDAGAFPWEIRTTFGTEPRTAPEDVFGDWRLVSGFLDGETIVPEPDAPILLNITDETAFNGHSGCNGYGGPMLLTPGRMSVGNLGTEHVRCGGSISVMEERYYYALARAREFALIDARLEMIGPGASVEFERWSEAPPGSEGFVFDGEIPQLLAQAEQLIGRPVRVTGDIGVVAEGGPLLTLSAGAAGIGEILVLFDTRLNGGEYSLDYIRGKPAVVEGTLLELTPENIDSVGNPYLDGAEVIEFMHGPQYLIISTNVIQD